MLTDCHAHLDIIKEPLDKIVKKSKEKRVRYIIHAGLEKTSNEFGINVSKKYDIILPAIGLYPEEVVKKSDDEIKEELKYIEENVKQAAAISEVGLDKTYGNLEKQKEILKEIVRIAIRNNKPLILHTRKAEKETIELLDNIIPNENILYRKIVFHCFMGKKTLIEEALKRGWFFSVPPIIVRSEHFKNLVKMTPLNRLLTETDSPFLGPIKEEKNYPWNVKYIIKEIAKIKSTLPSEVENNIFMNFSYLFL